MKYKNFLNVYYYYYNFGNSTMIIACENKSVFFLILHRYIFALAIKKINTNCSVSFLTTVVDCRF